jgi:hypothetical protein
MNNQMQRYEENHKSGEMEQYISMIPANIMSRSPEVLEYAALLGIERVDIPKMPSGEVTKWWYLIQLKTCKTCVFLSQKIPQFPYRDCSNPKVSPLYFDIVSRSLSLCDLWQAGFDEDRIDDEIESGYAENKYVLAAMIKMGLTDTPKDIAVPTVGGVEMLKFNLELASAADIYNSIVFAYVQAATMIRSGHPVDEDYLSQISKKSLPVVQGDKFNTNLLL